MIVEARGPTARAFNSYMIWCDCNKKIYSTRLPWYWYVVGLMLLAFGVTGMVKAEEVSEAQCITTTNYTFQVDSVSGGQSFTTNGWSSLFLSSISLRVSNNSTDTHYLYLKIGTSPQADNILDYTCEYPGQGLYSSVDWYNCVLPDLVELPEDTKLYLSVMADASIVKVSHERFSSTCYDSTNYSFYLGSTAYTARDLQFKLFTDTLLPEPEARATISGPSSIIIIIVSLLALIPGISVVLNII